MKFSKQILVGLAILGGFIAVPDFARAQFSSALPVQSVQADSVVQITADAQGLSRLSPDQVPRNGTYWLFMPGSAGIAVPAPCPPLDPSLPIYAIAPGQFLVDETVGNQATLNMAHAGRLVPSATIESILEAQANAAVNLITRVQTTAANEQMRAMGMNVPSFGDVGGSDSPVFNSGTSYIPDAFAFGISSQGTNVVLHWSSQTNRLYLIDHRPTLTSETHWNVLADYLLAAANTNVTMFVHSNILQTQPIDFYWLFDVTPVAHDDFFAVDQGSSANQLDILQNDTDPNDDPIYVANVSLPQHGSISYTTNATTFQYTPTSGFYGVDSFTYNITSGYGEVSSNATVTIFVNKSGNTLPSANDLIITLQTNVYSVTFNALTNASGNTPALYAVNSASMGSVSNDASGNITYTRNSNLFGDDAFTYVLTDANGGYAVGNVRVEQQDTSGDGLSDQWDLRYGFNPAVDNSMADPAGDGLPNLAKFVLGLNPNVANNPLNLSGVPNGTTVSGFAELPIYGLSMGIPKPPITLYLNGAPAENSFVAQGPDGQWQMNWDTSFLTNGNYQIQLGCQVAPASSPDSITNVMGASVNVQVNNPMTFDSFTSTFENFLLIYATLAVTNSTYDVYLYDENGNPLVYVTGLSAPNGQIALYWNLMDSHGNQISFDDIQALFYIHPPANPNGAQPATPQNSTPVRHRFHKDAGSINNNFFSIAWGWDKYSGVIEGDRYAIMQLGVVDILGSPAAYSSYSLLPVANIPLADSTFRYDTDSDKAILMHALNVSGNFFWFGHGSFNTIYGNPLRSAIGALDVEDLLGNKAWRSTPKQPMKNKHPYFLAILDACETSSSHWAGAFGVDFGPSHSYADYVNAGRPPRAFVGWSKTIRVPSNTDIGGVEGGQYGEAVGAMFGDWMDGYPLNYCLGDFSSQALSSFPSFTGADSWQISGCSDLERGD